jgi:acyl-CoA synthetase (AMP-forming)/AMP-acid ligase II
VKGPETLPALLAQRAADAAALEAVVCDRDRIDYLALDRLSADRAAWLVARGVNKGHRVALLMPNSVEWAVNACAIMRIGAVLTPLSTLLRPPELTAQLSIAGARHVIAASAHRGRNYREDFAIIDPTKLPSLQNIWWAEELGGGEHSAHHAVAAALGAGVRPADDMVVIFTSGSRDTPKGVIHTHGGAIRATAAGLADRCVHRGTRIYVSMPFFWVGGFGSGLLSALIAGATLLTEASPEPAATLRFLARERVTLFRGWPDQAARIAQHPDSGSVELPALGPGSLDALLPPALRGRPGSRANLFGMTETFGPYCGYPLDRDLPPDKFGSCGRPFSGLQLRIVDSATGAPVSGDEIGSIQVRSNNLLRGICGRERSNVFTPDGWYDTGDLGRLDQDGFLFFAGRRDDMVKIKGASVYPAEVEAALRTIPKVEHAFVTGLVVDGLTMMGAAIIPSKPGELDLQSLIDQARQRLSAFKVPARWAVLDSQDALPRTPTGKIDKAGLQALLIHTNANLIGEE